MPLSACSPAPTPTAQFVETNARWLHYKIMGKGPKVILLHGASGSLLDWSFKLMDLLAKDYQVLAFDRPGLGHSDAADDATLGEQAKIMRDAARVLGFGKAALVGHSFGGSVALKWALDAPQTVQSLLLLAAPSHLWEGSASRLYDLTNTPALGWLFSQTVPILATEARTKATIAAIFNPQTVPDGYVKHIQPALITRPATYRRNAAQVGLLKQQIREMAPRYPELTMPIELIHGTADTIVGLDIHSAPFARRMPNARLTRLEGVGHMLHHTNPDAFTSALKRLTQDTT